MFGSDQNQQMAARGDSLHGTFLDLDINIVITAFPPELYMALLLQVVRTSSKR